MNILKITIIQSSHGPDRIVLHTNLPTPFLPETGLGQPLELDFNTSHGYGEEYVAENFPSIPVEIV